MIALRARLPSIYPGKGAAAAGLVYVLLAGVLLYPGLFEGQTLVPADVLYSTLPWSAAGVAEQPRNPLLSDLVLQNYPWKRLALESLTRGELPLWNPYIFTGVPFLAAAQSSTLYPMGLPFFLLLPLEVAYTWFFGFHLVLGGLLAYWYLRTMGTGFWGSVLGGAIFCLGGFLVVSVQWPQAVGVMVWLPGLLTAIELALRRSGIDRLPPVLAGATVVACQFLAGHPELSLYLLLTAGAYAGARLTTIGTSPPAQGGGATPPAAAAAGITRLVPPAVACLAMVFIGTLLAAVQLVPFLDAIAGNQRAGASGFEQVREWALPAYHLIAFLVPDFFGGPAGDMSWGPKNYVEGTAYLGVLPLVLFVPAWLARRDFLTWFFTAWAVFSLLMAFGTPVYAIPFSTIPGFEQLHTPFRWVFPYSFSIAVLAARGLDALLDHHEATQRRVTAARWAGAAALISGGLLLAGTWATGTPGALDSLVDRSPRLLQAFGTGDAFHRFQAPHFLSAGWLLLLSGGGLLLVAAAQAATNGWGRLSPAGGRLARLSPQGLAGPATSALLLGLAAFDLVTFGSGFVTFQDPTPLTREPPAVERLRQDPEPFRVVAFGDRLLPPNSAMLAGLQDIRGYDTIVPKDYVEFWRRIEAPSGLPYSQIDRLASADSLDSPLLDLMNVKYVLTTQPVHHPSFRLVFQGEVSVYQNLEAMPRAYAVFRAIPRSGREQALGAVATPGFEPGDGVVIEEGGLASTAGMPAAAPAPRASVPARVDSYTPNRVTVSVDMPEAGYLVLSDAYAPGWQAREAGGDILPVLRANALFRAVPLDAGKHVVTFTYFPDSLKLGLYLSFLGAVMVGLGGAALLWKRVFDGSVPATVTRRVARNTVTPLAAQVVARAVDLGFAVFMLRLLGPADFGGFAFAGALIGYFVILTDFGLGTLLTREVARDPSQAPRYAGNVLTVRLLLCLGSAPIVAGVAWAYYALFGVSQAAALTTVLLMLALVPGSVAGALSAIFLAREHMEIPAAVVIFSSVAKALLGIAFLLFGWGILGLAVMTIVTSSLTALVFWSLTRRHFFTPRLTIDPSFSLGMLRASVPLVLNSLLNTIFFRVDILFLQAMRSAETVGLYSTAYKFVDALLIIPSTFTLALFPLMSRQAALDRRELARSYSVGLRALLLVALPATVAISIIAEDLVVTVFGEPYREAGLILKVLIWFVPFSFVNGLTQYVLIALDHQRFITGAFLAAAGFNVAGNLLVIPAYGAYGAAATTIASEVVLLVPFMARAAALTGRPRIGRTALRAGMAACGMGVLMALLGPLPFWILLPAGAFVYCAGVFVLRALTPEDLALLKRLLRL